jgi:hypothetical protein
MGKQVVSREEFITRIRAAVIARDSVPGGSDFVSDLQSASELCELIELLRLSLAELIRLRSSAWRRLSLV